jgi:hypothetical protein
MAAMTDTLLTTDPGECRYIKLGPAGAWAQEALKNGTLPFGYRLIDHALCAAGRWDDVLNFLLQNTSNRGTAQSSLRELQEYYSLGADCLWVTVADQKLYWGFADGNVEPILDAIGDQPRRLRNMKQGWRCADLKGQTLRLDRLSTRLTQVANYQRTICRVEARDYLLRMLRGEENEAAALAQAARRQMTQAAAALIQELHWKDFEILADLLLARAGWQRIGAVGGIQAEVDMTALQLATGERAFVQVKSRANAAVLEESIAQFRRSGYQRMFFFCHSFKEKNLPQDSPGIHLLIGNRLAELTVDCGLLAWLINRAG